MRRTDEAFKNELFRRYEQYKKNRRSLRILAAAPVVLSILVLGFLLPNLNIQTEQPTGSTPEQTTHASISPAPDDPITTTASDLTNAVRPFADFKTEDDEGIPYVTQIRALYLNGSEALPYSFMSEESPESAKQMAKLVDFLNELDMVPIAQEEIPTGGARIEVFTELFTYASIVGFPTFTVQGQYITIRYVSDFDGSYMISKSDADTLEALLRGYPD